MTSSLMRQEEETYYGFFYPDYFFCPPGYGHKKGKDYFCRNL